MAISVADNFQYLGTKPLDARLKFASVSDMVSTAAASLYDGCFAYVTATKKYYSYDSTNTVDVTLGKWREYSSGGDTIQVSSMPTASASELGNVYQYIGSTTLAYTHGYFYECVSDGAGTPTYSWEEVSTSKGGHDIKNDGVAVTSRDTMNFTDFDIADDSTNLETDIKAHRLTQAEMTEIMSTLPGVPSVDAIVFDERGTEYQIGWYVFANGTKKPVYRKDFVLSGSGDVTQSVTSLSIDKVLTLKGMTVTGDGAITPIPTYNSSNANIGVWVYENTLTVRFGSQYTNNNLIVNLFFTKTTDTPV